jgi:2-succinyl-5-enolpyruvyl-6-hydroxy-3-cyclohexene-1-carboxylate synthase
MTDVDVTTSFARTLVDEWARAGVTHAVVSPGSRNTPLVLALARDTRIQVDVVVDERSAAFVALGIGLRTRRPAIVCCTSGTAAANLHPAVIEAHHARVPMLVCTADRPPELRDCGAGQTIDQTHLFGGAVRWFHDPGPPSGHSGAPAQWRAIAARACITSLGPPAGPVHLNLPFREPLVPTGGPLVDAPGRADGQPWTRHHIARAQATPHTVAGLASLVRASPKGVILAGWGSTADPEAVARFARASGWPLLADPLSHLRAGPHAVSTYEALLRAGTFAAAHRPDLVLQLGAAVTSKVTNSWLAGVPRVLVDPDHAWLDPSRATAEHVAADPTDLLDALSCALATQDVTPHGEWAKQWQEAERRVRAAVDHELDACDAPIEGLVARDLASAIPDGGTLLVASSLPVRALEWCMAPRDGLQVVANRGANGIDGFVSTVAGIAKGADGEHSPVVGLCGDLCFLHDTNGLLALRETDARIVVIDNGGGGIFDYLPQHEVPEFGRLFVTPTGLDPVAVARAHDVDARRLDHTCGWTAIIGDGPQVVVIPVDRNASVDGHRRLWRAAATAVAGS